MAVHRSSGGRAPSVRSSGAANRKRFSFEQGAIQNTELLITVARTLAICLEAFKPFVLARLLVPLRCHSHSAHRHAPLTGRKQINFFSQILYMFLSFHVNCKVPTTVVVHEYGSWYFTIYMKAQKHIKYLREEINFTELHGKKYRILEIYPFAARKPVRTCRGGLQEER